MDKTMPNEPEETVNDTPENETEVVEPESTESESPEAPMPKDDKELKSALAQKEHFREKAEKAEAERKALEEKLQKAMKSQDGTPSPALDVDDYIDISTSLDGLDARQKAYLAEQHKLSGKPMKEIRESEDFQLWNEAYSTRLEKEAALKPNSTQEQEDVPKSFAERLKNATFEEREALLAEKGLIKASATKKDRVDIGDKRPLY